MFDTARFDTLSWPEITHIPSGLFWFFVALIGVQQWFLCVHPWRLSPLDPVKFQDSSVRHTYLIDGMNGNDTAALLSCPHLPKIDLETLLSWETLFWPPK